jgi:hypothetical protein
VWAVAYGDASAGARHYRIGRRIAVRAIRRVDPRIHRTWWDVSVMLMLGGVPWNCYFPRVLSCRTPRAAQADSILSGVMTIALTLPPLLMGLVAFAYVWLPAIAERVAAQPTDAAVADLQTVPPPGLTAGIK